MLFLVFYLVVCHTSLPVFHSPLSSYESYKSKTQELFDEALKLTIAEQIAAEENVQEKLFIRRDVDITLSHKLSP